MDCQAARLYPLDAFTRETIALGSFPRGVIEHPALGVEIKINPVCFKIVIRRDESDMPPGCAGIGVHVQLKLVGEEALVTVKNPHIPRGYHTPGLLDILERFGLENDPAALIWWG